MKRAVWVNMNRRTGDNYDFQLDPTNVVGRGKTKLPATFQNLVGEKVKSRVRYFTMPFDDQRRTMSKAEIKKIYAKKRFVLFTKSGHQSLYGTEYLKLAFGKNWQKVSLSIDTKSGVLMGKKGGYKYFVAPIMREGN
jgi:hypothetical protein